MCVVLRKDWRVLESWDMPAWMRETAYMGIRFCTSCNFLFTTCMYFRIVSDVVVLDLNLQSMQFNRSQFWGFQNLIQNYRPSCTYSSLHNYISVSTVHELQYKCGSADYLIIFPKLFAFWIKSDGSTILRSNKKADFFVVGENFHREVHPHACG